MKQEASNTIKKDLNWNMIGSLTYAAANAALAFLVMRFAGAEDGGIFAFGFSTFGQQMFIIAYFGMRPFQLTDVSPEYFVSEYRRTRVETCVLAVVAALAYLGALTAVGTYTARKGLIVFLLALYKIADGYADVLESECQRLGMLWRGGRELCLRTLFAAGLLTIALLCTGDLIVAAAAGVIAQVTAAVLFIRNLNRTFTKCSKATETAKFFGRFRAGKDRALVKSTALLFLSVFLDFYVFSGAKYAIDMKLSDTVSGVFNILFMPTSVIYLAANFIIRPFMTRMASQLEEGDEAGFTKTRRSIALVMALFTAVALLCTAFLGGVVLKLFELLLGDAYAGQLSTHTGEFFLIILGGGFYAMANLYYYILVMKRRQKAIFVVYLVGAILTLTLSGWVVGTYGMSGGAALYAALMSLLLFGMKLCDMIY